MFDAGFDKLLKARNKKPVAMRRCRDCDATLEKDNSCFYTARGKKLQRPYCRSCWNSRQRDDYYSHHEARKASKRMWMENNKEKRQAYLERTRPERLEKAKQRYRDNVEARKAYAREYYQRPEVKARNAERNRRYYAENREKMREYYRARRAAAKEAKSES